MNALKEFEVREGSTENMWYSIRVYRYGELVEEFLRPTMGEAQLAFWYAGYYR